LKKDKLLSDLAYIEDCRRSLNELEVKLEDELAELELEEYLKESLNKPYLYLVE
jgi:hypothetical protein